MTSNEGDDRPHISDLLGGDEASLSPAGATGAAEPNRPQPPDREPPGEADAGCVQPSSSLLPPDLEEDGDEEPPLRWDRPVEAFEKVEEALRLLREVKLDDLEWELAQKYGRGASRRAAESPFTLLRSQLTAIKRTAKELLDDTKGWSRAQRYGLDTTRTGSRPDPITEEEWASAIEAASRHVPEASTVDLGPLFDQNDFAGLRQMESEDDR